MQARLVMRMTLPVVVISLLLLALGIATAWYVHEHQKAASQILDSNVASMRAAEELAIDLWEIQTKVNHALITGHREELAWLPELKAHADYWLAEATRLATTPREQELVRQIQVNYDDFFPRLDAALDESKGPLDARHVHALMEEVLAKSVLAPAHAYLDLNEELAKEASARNKALAERMVFGLSLLGICGATAGLVGGFGIAWGLNRSLVQLCVPIRDAAGKLNQVVGPIAVSTNVELPALEDALRSLSEQVGTVVERLQRSQREVLRAEQLAAIGQLAAGMAHELRNPLAAIRILVQSAIHHGRGIPPGSRDLAVLDDETARLERLMQTFLEFARPPKLQRQAFDVARITRQTLDLVASRAERQHARLHFEGPAEPLVLEADLVQFRQLLLNLLLNALDAVPPGGDVWVAAARQTRAEIHAWPTVAGMEEWLLLTVSNSGNGLPAELGQRIFEPFVSTKETGLGLGLSICRTIVEAHGGSLAARDRPEGGATFFVHLPVAARREAATAPSHNGEACRANLADRG